LSSTVICSTEYKQSDSDLKIVPVNEKLRRDPWGFRQQRWLTPTESGINDGERRLFDVGGGPPSQRFQIKIMMIAGYSRKRHSYRFIA